MRHRGGNFFLHRKMSLSLSLWFVLLDGSRVADQAVQRSKKQQGGGRRRRMGGRGEGGGGGGEGEGWERGWQVRLKKPDVSTHSLFPLDVASGLDFFWRTWFFNILGQEKKEGLKVVWRWRSAARVARCDCYYFPIYGPYEHPSLALILLACWRLLFWWGGGGWLVKHFSAWPSPGNPGWRVRCVVAL